MENIQEDHRKISRKRVDIVTIQMVKEKSVLYSKRKISSSGDATKLVQDFLENNDRETLVVCCLDTKNQPTNISVVSIGSLNTTLVHPREVFKCAILSNSNSILLFHNHPSGDTTPSKDDIKCTERIKSAGEILGIKLIDHIIIGADGTYSSFNEKGLM